MFSVEHAPQRQATLLGTARACCVLCEPCNNTSSYEQQTAAHKQRLRRLASGEISKFPWIVDGTRRQLKSQLKSHTIRLTDPPRFEHQIVPDVRLQPFENLTILKAGFVVAFSVLGYRWATSPALDSVRSAIREGDPTHVGATSLVSIHDGHEEGANQLIYSEESNQVLVVGDSGRWGVVLPLSPELPTSQNLDGFSGWALPWLPDQWWAKRELVVEPFIWDYHRPEFLQEHYWQLEILEAAV